MALVIACVEIIPGPALDAVDLGVAVDTALEDALAQVAGVGDEGEEVAGFALGALAGGQAVQAPRDRVGTEVAPVVAREQVVRVLAGDANRGRVAELAPRDVGDAFLACVDRSRCVQEVLVQTSRARRGVVACVTPIDLLIADQALLGGRIEKVSHLAI